MSEKPSARGGARAKPPETASAAPPNGRRERNKLEKRARIVAAARRLFAEKGFTATTTLEIAEAADIGTGTLFLYARSKEDLLIMVFQDEMIEQAAAAFSNVRKTDALPDQLVQVFSAMVSYHERDREQAKILLREIMFPLNQERRSNIDELMSVIYKGLAGLLERGRPSKPAQGRQDTMLAAENLFAIYFFNLLGWLSGRLTKPAMLNRLKQHISAALEPR